MDRDRIEKLREASRAAYAEWQAAEVAAKVPRTRYYALEAERHEAEGDDLHARWCRALAVGDHDECERCAAEYQARRERENVSAVG